MVDALKETFDYTGFTVVPVAGEPNQFHISDNDNEFTFAGRFQWDGKRFDWVTRRSTTLMGALGAMQFTDKLKDKAKRAKLESGLKEQLETVPDDKVEEVTEKLKAEDATLDVFVNLYRQYRRNEGDFSTFWANINTHLPPEKHAEVQAKVAVFQHWDGALKNVRGDIRMKNVVSALQRVGDVNERLPHAKNAEDRKIQTFVIESAIAGFFDWERWKEIGRGLSDAARKNIEKIWTDLDTGWKKTDSAVVRI